MSKKRKPINWVIAGPALVTLATVSPPAAAAAGVALGAHEAYTWWKNQDEGDTPDEVLVQD
jgi:hypothetical protein